MSKYQRLATACDLSMTPLVEAAKQLAPSRIFHLHVSSRHYYEGKDLAARAMERENPFSPYINLVPDLELKDGEWYIEDENGKAVGSEGAG